MRPDERLQPVDIIRRPLSSCIAVRRYGTCNGQRSCMQQVHGRIARGSLLAVVLALALSALASAAAPSSATLGPTSGPVSWDGFGSVAAASPDGEATCVEGTTCDTFTLTLAAADYRGKRVRVKASWT